MFRAPALSGSPSFAFHTVGGRHILLLFFGSARLKEGAKALRGVQANRDIFDDERACFFGVTVDPEDAGQGRIAPQVPGIRFFLDYDRSISALYGAAVAGADAYLPQWVVLDPAMRILRIFPIAAGAQAIQCLRDNIEACPQDLWAPVLRVPNVLEPEFCRDLIGIYEARGGESSGFMREVDGKTIVIADPKIKQRRDYMIEDERIRNALVARVERRLAPAIQQAFQFKASRIERYLIACYEAGAGHFRPHRDNTTKGTAHRKFAVSINLNAGEYEGGDLRFPEYGNRTYCPPTGGAVVFSCSILHEATPVTKGKRYAFLPFLYDEEAARIREANNPYLGEGIGEYRAGAEAEQPRPPPKRKTRRK